MGSGSGALLLEDSVVFILYLVTSDLLLGGSELAVDDLEESRESSVEGQLLGCVVRSYKADDGRPTGVPAYELSATTYSSTILVPRG